MSSSTLIGLMTTGFGLITIAAIVWLLYRLRRRPIVWLLRSAERRVAFHRDAVAVLASALNSARIEGRRDEFYQLASSFRMHADSLRSLDPAAALPHVAAFESRP